MSTLKEPPVQGYLQAKAILRTILLILMATKRQQLVLKKLPMMEIRYR
jgi:hypothetical protein